MPPWITSLLRLEVSCPCRARRSRITTSVLGARRAATASPTTPAPMTATPVSAMAAFYREAASGGGRRSGPEHGHAQGTRPRPVELGQEQALPAAEADPAARQGERLRGAQKKGLAVRVPVGRLVRSDGGALGEVVVAIGEMAGGHAFE